MSDKKVKKHEKMPPKTVFTVPKDSFGEGVDFYIENGLYVFTEKYLRERGYCCKNGCRHCPYKT